MTFIKKIFSNYLPCLLLSFVCLQAQAQVQVTINIENPIDDDEAIELEYYVYSLLAASTNPKEDAEAALSDLERFESIVCHSEQLETQQKVSCVLKRIPIVQNIRFTGVPLLILEKELKKRMPVKIGDLINLSSPQFQELIARAETAIISYLERQGYFHAKASTSYEQKSGTPSTDIVFKVEGGSFVRVKNVILKTNIKTTATLDPELVLKPFRQMCANIRHSFEGIFQGTKACYNKDIEEDTISSVEETLADLGFVESHLAVVKHFVERKVGPPKEVELEVVLRLGPKLVVNFEFNDAQTVDAGFFGTLFRTISGTELFSRAFGLKAQGARFPEDQTILIASLREALTFRAAQAVDDDQIVESVLAIKEALRTRGYMSAKVTYKKDTTQKSQLSITFKIDPQYPASISKIRLSGAAPFTFEEIDRNTSLVLLPRSLFSSGHFNLADLQKDTTAIQDFFVSRGYTNAKVDPSVQTISNELEILYQVELGDKKSISKFVFSNDNPDLTKQFLKSRKLCAYKSIERIETSTIVKCDLFPYEENKVENYRLQLFDLYRKNGFLSTEPKSTVVQEENETIVQYDFPNSNLKAKVAELLVNGNLKTFRSVIERELGSKFVTPTNDYIPQKVDEGLGRLRSSGVFSKLSLDTVLKANSKDEYYLNLNISERPTFTGDLPFSFDSDYYFNVGFYLQERNLFGALLQLRTELDFGLFIGRRSGFRNTLTWPRLFGTPMTIDFRVPELLYEIRATEKIPKRHAMLKTSVDVQWEFLKLLYPKIEFQFRIDKWQVASSASDFQGFSFFQDPIKAISTLDGLLDVLAEPASLRALLIPSVSAVSIDNFLDPKFGYKLSAAFQLSGKAFGSTIGFDVLDLEGTGYYTFGWATFAFHAQLQRGFIDDPDNNWWVLKYESDFETLGGSRGPRAYEKGKLGIYGPLLDGSGTPRLDTTGTPPYKILKDYHSGNLMIQSGLELRFPIANKFLIGRLDGALFAEFGFVGSCKEELFCFNEVGERNDEGQNRQLGSTLGAGLRLMLPVGPFAVDYGFSLAHNISRVNFQFGFPF